MSCRRNSCRCSSRFHFFLKYLSITRVTPTHVHFSCILFHLFSALSLATVLSLLISVSLISMFSLLILSISPRYCLWIVLALLKWSVSIRMLFFCVAKRNSSTILLKSVQILFSNYARSEHSTESYRAISLIARLNTWENFSYSVKHSEEVSAKTFPIMSSTHSLRSFASFLESAFANA